MNIDRLAIIAMIGFLVAGCDSPWSDTVTVYSAECANGVSIIPLALRDPAQNFNERYAAHQDSFRRCEISPRSRTTYRINPARGEVYYVLFNRPSRLVDCAIMDRENWSCSYPDGSGRVTVVDGLEAISQKDIDFASSYSSPPFFYMRRWQWWIASAAAVLKGFGLYSRPIRGSLLIPEQKSD